MELCSTDANVYFTAATGVPLLDQETAKVLEVLKIAANIAALHKRIE